MKAFLFLSFTLLFIFDGVSNIVYVDHFDAVYPFTVGTTPMFDIDNDGEDDISLENYNGGQLTCGITTCGSSMLSLFEGLTTIYGQNHVTGNGVTILGIDSSGDTLNVNSPWNTISRVHYGCPTEYCSSLGFGTHKQGFRLIQPTGSGLGYIYGYIDYTLTNLGDIIIHGWYYEDEYNTPIVCNSLLDYPYMTECVHIDTTFIDVFDTTYVVITDTVTFIDTVYVETFDTTYISVTDTLVIDVAYASVPTVLMNRIKVYPNPAMNIIYIDNGDFSTISQYVYIVKNALGQVVTTIPVSGNIETVDITNWGGSGIYYLSVLDDNFNVQTVRKIVLE